MNTRTNSAEIQTKLLAVQKLLLEPSTTREKYSAIRSLIQGYDVRLDAVLKECDDQIAVCEKICAGQVLDLSAENLPENSEEQKRRKKALLLLLGSWNKLKGEVTRVQSELASAQMTSEEGETSWHWGRILHGAKGPLGLITIAAIGVVVVMQHIGVTLRIENTNCGAFMANSSMPISIPGLSLPAGEIVSGASVEAVIPPLTLQIDGTQYGSLTITAASFSLTFQLPSNIQSVTLDAISLMGGKQEIKLGDMKNHTLVLKCL